MVKIAFWPDGDAKHKVTGSPYWLNYILKCTWMSEPIFNHFQLWTHFSLDWGGGLTNQHTDIAIPWAMTLAWQKNISTPYQRTQSLVSYKQHVANAAKSDIPFSYCWVKGCLLISVDGQSFPPRLLSHNVFWTPDTANFFTDKESCVLFLTLDQAYLRIWISLFKWICQKDKTKIITVTDCTYAYIQVRNTWK